MSDYDTWLLDQAEYYTAPCEPEVIGVHQEPSDGEIMSENIYSCEECDNSECEYWNDYNDRAEIDEALLWGI